MDTLFEEQTDKLEKPHFLILYWSTLAEDKESKYNITNVFDDLKYGKITRTKQSAVAYVETLSTMCFIELRDESNRKNLYLTNYGAKALEKLIVSKKFELIDSNYLED